MKTKYKYSFNFFGQDLTLAVGESFTDITDGQVVRVKRFRRATEIMDHLVVQVIGHGPEVVLECGQRIPGGKLREDFKRIELKTPVIVSKINYESNGQKLTYLKFLATDGHATILSSVTCDTEKVQETVQVQCEYHKYVVV